MAKAKRRSGLAGAALRLQPDAGWGWVLLALVTLFLTWLLVLGWPRLTSQERLMRVAVVALAVAITVTQAIPR